VKKDFLICHLSFLHLFMHSQRPEGTKPASSFETNPSFSLFKDSFDSFGDGHYFNVDSTLQNDSFGIGMGRTTSVDPDGATQILRSSSAGENISLQLLASSSGAAPTFGCSPVNSFGNVSASGGGGGGSTRRLQMVGGGGPDPLTNSPSQVLGMYRSYSGAAEPTGPSRSSGPLDDSHLRMSVGSFGAQSMAYSRSYGEPTGSPNTYYYAGPNRPQESPAAVERSPPFYAFLKKHRAAFMDCIFLLPGLKTALLEMPVSTGIDDPDAAVSLSMRQFLPTNMLRFVS